MNNFLSYSGMEMNAVHVSSLRKPAKEFPRAMFLAMGLVLLIFILPALAISWVVPGKELSLTAGVMQAFDAVFAQFGWQVLTPIVGVMLVAAVRLRRKEPDHPRGYRAPMLVGLCGVGFAASLAALLVGFIPPSQFGGGHVGLYILIVGGGALGLGLLVPYLFYRFRKPSWRQPVEEAA